MSCATRSQVGIGDTSPFTPVSTVHLQGVQLTTCVQTVLLPPSLALDHQWSLCTVNPPTYPHYVLTLQPGISVFLSIFSSIAAPCRASMTYFQVYVTFSSVIHQDALAFTWQKICAQMRPSPPQQVARVNTSCRSFTLVFRAVHRWSQHRRCILIPTVVTWRGAVSSTALRHAVDVVSF